MLKLTVKVINVRQLVIAAIHARENLKWKHMNTSVEPVNQSLRNLLNTTY